MNEELLIDKMNTLIAHFQKSLTEMERMNQEIKQLDKAIDEFAGSAKTTNDHLMELYNQKVPSLLENSKTVEHMQDYLVKLRPSIQNLADSCSMVDKALERSGLTHVEGMKTFSETAAMSKQYFTELTQRTAAFWENMESEIQSSGTQELLRRMDGLEARLSASENGIGQKLAGFEAVLAEIAMQLREKKSEQVLPTVVPKADAAAGMAGIEPETQVIIEEFANHFHITAEQVLREAQEVGIKNISKGAKFSVNEADELKESLTFKKKVLCQAIVDLAEYYPDKPMIVIAKYRKIPENADVISFKAIRPYCGDYSTYSLCDSMDFDRMMLQKYFPFSSIMDKAKFYLICKPIVYVDQGIKRGKLLITNDLGNPVFSASQEKELKYISKDKYLDFEKVAGGRYIRW